ncbi:hypothetical protein BDV93DRAFT_564869 [Ceratobasidium sp. AG-I]|nr:hypothetical protein BDV93DRAFT_564869 [Ceratobasidium sp. AG-I]
MSFASTIRAGSNEPVLSLSYDPARNLLVCALKTRVLILNSCLTPTRRRKWIVVDEFTSEYNARVWNIYKVELFGGQNRSVLVSTNHGLIIWNGNWAPLKYYPLEYLIGDCTISPSGAHVAVSTPDLQVFIWPLCSAGLDLKPPPLSFTKDDVLVVADPIGRLYFVSADGTQTGTLNCGQNHFVRAIHVSPTLWHYISATGTHMRLPESLGLVDQLERREYLARQFTLNERTLIVQLAEKLKAIDRPPAIRKLSNRLWLTVRLMIYGLALYGLMNILCLVMPSICSFGCTHNRLTAVDDLPKLGPPNAGYLLRRMQNPAVMYCILQFFGMYETAKDLILWCTT